MLAVDVREHQTPASDCLQCDLRDAASIGATLGQLGLEWDMLAHVAGILGTAPAADVPNGGNYLGMRLMTEGMLPTAAPGRFGRRRRVDGRALAGISASRHWPDCWNSPTPSR